MKINRNDACHCKSGKKYKKCCLANDELNSIVDNRMALKTKGFTFEYDPELEDECNEVLDNAEAGNITAAEIAARELYSENPRSYITNYTLGIILLQENNISDGMEYLKKSIDINPIFGQGYYNLGAAYMKLVDTCNAVRHFKKAIELEKPNSEIAQQAQEQLQFLEETTQKVEGCSLDEYVRAGEFFNMAFESLDRGEYQHAIELFERVVAFNPEHTQSYGNMGIAYGYLGKNKRALECLDKALSIDPTYQPALQNRKVIAALPEGMRLPRPMQTVNYYRDMHVHKII